MNKRTLVIGDIHGGLKALHQVLERASVTTDDTLIFLGDYVDGWCDSYELIEYLIELNKSYTCIFIKGNHDVWCDEYLRSGEVPVIGINRTWRDMGGTTTIDSYMNREPSYDLESHIKFFYYLLNHYVDDDNRVFVHAGYSHDKGVRFESPMRNLWWDRHLFDNAYDYENHYTPIVGKTPPNLLEVYKEIFIGHTTTQLYGTIQPIFVCNVINIDTGCGHLNGVLTIMDVDSKEYWQSDRLKTLYPLDPHIEFMPNKYCSLV